MKRPLAWLRAQFWLLPLLCALVSVILGLTLTAVDESLGTSFNLPFLFAGGPEGARSLLSAVITSMISFTGLVFSITIVVLQLTSSQFSPRVLRTFLNDRMTQLSLGVFVATFVYALVVLRGVRGTAQVDAFIPQIAVTVAFAFVLASVLVFLAYIHHIAQSIRVATIIANIGGETRKLLERRHPQDTQDPPPEVSRPAGKAREVSANRAGVVQRIDDKRLAVLAERHQTTIFLRRAIGEFVPEGALLLDICGAGTPEDQELRGAVALGQERTMEQDVGFGLRQLVDIAERALSPGVNDPTTAVQVVDALHDLLRRLATRRLVPRTTLGADDRVLVWVPQPSFGDYLDLAVTEIAHWGRDDERIRRRLQVMLADLDDAARTEHRAPIRLIRQSLGLAHGASGAAAPNDIGLR